MRRITVLEWWLASFVVWFLLGHLLAGLFLHISWDVPLWLQHGTEWVLRKVEPDPHYYPDAYDIEGALSLLLFIIAYLFATVIVVPASVIAWRCTHPH